MDGGLPGTLPPVLDSAGVACLLGLNRRTVLLMARDGRLPGRRVPGGRKYQFLTAEVLAALASETSHITEPRIDQPSAEAAPTAPRGGDVDPCDVWGAAPGPRGQGWALTCLNHWTSLAVDAGLAVVHLTMPGPETRGPCVGVVAVDDLTYRVFAGPRKRLQVVDDDGDERWELIDSVWVEPAVESVG